MLVCLNESEVGVRRPAYALRSSPTALAGTCGAGTWPATISAVRRSAFASITPRRFSRPWPVGTASTSQNAATGTRWRRGSNRCWTLHRFDKRQTTPVSRRWLAPGHQRPFDTTRVFRLSKAPRSLRRWHDRSGQYCPVLVGARDQCRMVKRWCTVASTAHEMILGLNPGERTNGRGHGERRESGRPRSTYAGVPGDATKGRVITDSSERRASHPQFDRYTGTVVRWNRGVASA